MRGAAKVTDRTWTCERHHAPARGFAVEVRITGRSRTRTDAVHLNAGCSGEITLRVVIERGWDCIKVHAGARDLTVRGWCEIRGRVGAVHQDFVQAMGGRNVTFRGFETRTAGQKGWNGGGGPGGIHSSFFVNTGAGGAGRPSSVVCDGCVLAGGGSPVWVNRATGSGVRNSTIVRGRSGRCVTITANATAGVNRGNRCLKRAP